jgi:hypothetical protein
MDKEPLRRSYRKRMLLSTLGISRGLFEIEGKEMISIAYEYILEV